MEDVWETIVRTRYATYATVTELKMYILQKRYADGYEAGNKMLVFLRERNNSILAQGVLFNLMTKFCYQLEKYKEVLEYIDRFNSCKKEWDKYPEPQSLDPFSDCAPYMSAKEACRLSLLRLHIHVLQRDWENAEMALFSIDWNGDQLPLLKVTPADVAALLKRKAYDETEERPLTGNGPDDRNYISALNAIYSKEDMRPHLYAAIDQSEPEEKGKLMTYLYQISPEDVKICVYHLIYAGNQGDIEAATLALEKMQKENYPLFLEDEAYWESLQKLDININAYITTLSIYRWMELAKHLWEVVDLDICEKAYSCLTRGLEKTDLRYLYISALLIEKKLLKKEKMLEKGLSKADKASEAMYSAAEIWNELYQLSQYWVSCAATLYREDVFMGDLIGAIPSYYQFGWYIMQANAVQNSDPDLFIQKVADAAKAYPALKELCKKIIRNG